MIYGHLINNDTLELTTLPITIGGIDYFTEDKNLMLKAGEKEVVYSEKPVISLGEYVVNTWEETSEKIIQKWIIKDDRKDEQLMHAYECKTKFYVRQKYELEDENKIMREYLAYGDAHKAAFDEYNLYVEECKKKAHKEVYGV